jgi:hypothetical protein
MARGGLDHTQQKKALFHDAECKVERMFYAWRFNSNVKTYLTVKGIGPFRIGSVLSWQQSCCVSPCGVHPPRKRVRKVFQMKNPGLMTFAILMIVFPMPLLSQDAGTGTLYGVVTDPSGSGVANASVTATATATGLVRTSATDGSGNYTFTVLPIGQYDVTVSNAGFATITNKGVTVSVGTPTNLNVALKIATASETISVEAHGEVLNTSNAETGGLFTPAQVTDLPLDGRNFLNLVNLEAGIRSDTISGRQSFVINGAPPQQGFNFMLDGTDATGVETGEVGGGWTSPYQSTYTMSLDSIAEFVVHSSSYSAKYGRALGGVVEAVTKSGENTPHGNVFYFMRNDIFNANTIQANAAGLPRPELRFNQYGANTGGPILRNRMFFWVGFEGVNRRTGVTNTYTVLSPDCRASLNRSSSASRA